MQLDPATGDVLSTGSFAASSGDVQAFADSGNDDKSSDASGGAIFVVGVLENIVVAGRNGTDEVRRSHQKSNALEVTNLSLAWCVTNTSTKAGGTNTAPFVRRGRFPFTSTSRT